MSERKGQRIIRIHPPEDQWCIFRGSWTSVQNSMAIDLIVVEMFQNGGPTTNQHYTTNDKVLITIHNCISLQSLSHTQRFSILCSFVYLSWAATQRFQWAAGCLGQCTVGRCDEGGNAQQTLLTGCDSLENRQKDKGQMNKKKDKATKKKKVKQDGE